MPSYKVTVQPSEEATTTTRLVEAKSPAQAIQFVAKDTIKAEKISTKEAYELGKQGIEMEDATADTAAPAATEQSDD